METLTVVVFSGWFTAAAFRAVRAALPLRRLFAMIMAPVVAAGTANQCAFVSCCEAPAETPAVRLTGATAGRGAVVETTPGEAVANATDMLSILKKTE